MAGGILSHIVQTEQSLQHRLSFCYPTVKTPRVTVVEGVGLTRLSIKVFQISLTVASWVGRGGWFRRVWIRLCHQTFSIAGSLSLDYNHWPVVGIKGC